MLYVPLPLHAREALTELARTELRRAQDQAVILLVKALEERGLLQQPTEDGAPAAATVRG